MTATKGMWLGASGALLLGGAIAIASLFGEPQHRLVTAVHATAGQQVTPTELAEWIITGRRDFVVIDMRSRGDYEAAHVRGAVHCGQCHESREAGLAAQHGEDFVDLSKKLVLYTATDNEPVVLPTELHDNPQLLRLAGGFAAWRQDILAPVSFAGLPDEAALLAAKKREAVRGLMSGERAVTPNVAKLPLTPIKRSGAHKPVGGAEGC